ncbi:MAG: hypothetical protein ACI8RD_007689 [Bacillariaceae sp.]|jgi:hypothetical protein
MDEEGSIIIDDDNDDDYNDNDNHNDEERRYWIQHQENSSLTLSLTGHRRRRSVLIRYDKLPALANEILMQRQQTAAATETTNVSSKDEWIEWDTEGWHYNGSGFNGTEDERRERVALYLLALDAINFCFWPLSEEKDDDDDDNKNKTASTSASATPAKKINSNNNNKINLLEYDHLAMALKKMAEADHVVSKSDNDDDDDDDDENNKKQQQQQRNEYVFSPSNLATMTTEKMSNLLRPYLDESKYPLPNIQKRAQLWKEVGEGIIRDYNGAVLNLLNYANQDASRLVELLLISFPGFRDDVYISSSSSSSSSQHQQQQQQQRLVFLKRAQIFVGDINAALKLQLNGMERLTTFADYRVPQVLRHWKILVYSSLLSNKVDNYIEIKKGSYEEISIRAATIVVVEELVKLLNRNNNNNNNDDDDDDGNNNNERCRYTDVTVDWYLWQVGERMHQEGIMKPFHKVRTHFY